MQPLVSEAKIFYYKVDLLADICFIKKLISEKLEVEISVIKNSVEGLIHLLLESCRYKVI